MLGRSRSLVSEISMPQKTPATQGTGLEGKIPAGNIEKFRAFLRHFCEFSGNMRSCFKIKLRNISLK